MSQKRKPSNNCTITYLTGEDKFVISITMLFTGALFVAIVGILLAISFQFIYTVRDNFDLIFCKNPSIKICLYIGFYLLILIVGSVWAVGLFFPSFNIFNRMMSGILYKVIFLNGDTIIKKGYYTLRQVEDMGYHIQYTNNNTSTNNENKEEENIDE